MTSLPIRMLLAVTLFACLAMLGCENRKNSSVRGIDNASEKSKNPPPPSREVLVPQIHTVQSPVALPAAPAVVAVAATALPTEKEPLNISRSYCSAAGCKLTFRFSQEMVKKAALATAEPAKIVFDPPQAGRWRWTSTKELVFTPKKGALEWGHEIRIRLEEATPLAGPDFALASPWSQTFHVPYFRVAGKYAGWPVRRGKPRFVAVLDQYQNYDGEIGTGPLFLAFDQPVSPTKMARHIRARVGNKDLKVAVWRPKTIARVWSEDDVDTRSILAVRIAGLPSDGTLLTLHFPKDIKGPKKNDIDFTTRKYTVRSELQVESVKLRSVTDGGRAPLNARWEVRFTGAVGDEVASRSIHLTPKAKHTYIYATGSSVYVDATLEPGKRYRLHVNANLRDKLGNTIGKGTQHDFRAQDLVPKLQLPNRATVLEYASKRLPLRITNIRGVKLTTHPVGDVASYIRSLDKNLERCATRASAGTASLKGTTTRNRQLVVNAALKTEHRGLACVAIRGYGVGSEKQENRLRTFVLTQVTDLGITAKVHRSGIIVWVTRLSDAKPVPGATISLRDENGSLVSTTIADKDGVARLEGKTVTERASVNTSYLVAEHKSDLALTKLTDKRISQPWQFGLDGDVTSSEPLRASVFTDRGVYRPKETVHLKVIAREIGQSGELERTLQRDLHVTINDARGSAVLKKTLELDEYGTADLSLDLKENAAVGKYTVRVEQSDRVTSASFSVEEYRVPTFNVAVKSEQGSWSPRERARVSISADYLHGGKLAARRVAYTVSRVSAPLKISRFSDFTFGQPSLRLPEKQLVTAEGKLDGQGMLSFDFAPQHPVSAGRMRYIVDAHVTDVDHQAYRGQMTKIVNASDLYLGMRRPARNVMRSGDALSVPVVAVTPDGQVKAGVPVTIRAEAIDYHTTARIAGGAVERHNRAVARPVARCNVRTGRTAKRCSLRLRKAGHYRISATARDGKKRNVLSSFEVTVGGNQRIAWPRFDHERIEILTDKATYQPGDVAKLAIQSPFSAARGILTLERGDVLEHRSFEIKDNTPILDIPITNEHAPNIYASVVLLRGRMHDRSDATGFETGAPAFRVGYAKLSIEAKASRLGVKVALDRDVVEPGGTLAVHLDVRDAAGANVTGQATVMIVDEAVLGLTRFGTPDPIKDLYRARALGVRTASSRLDLPHSRRERREPIFPGGGGGDEYENEGGEMAKPEQFADLRTLFESTAYWNPRVAIKDGIADLTVRLPDNVTTFRVMAVVVDSGSRAGSADGKVVVRKPVMVKPVLPRFAYPDDKMVVSARVFNGGSEPGSATVSAQFVGLRRTNRKAKSKIIEAGGSAMFSFPAQVVGKDQAVVRFTATIGNSRDGVEVKLPILDPGTRSKTIETQTVGESGTIVLKLPKERTLGTTSLEIIASSTSLSELRDAVGYVMNYPNGCIEQTTSTAYPLIVLEDLLPDIGITVDKAQLKEFATAGVKRLLSFQTTSGGLAYWPGSDDPHAFGTAFGLTALIEAKARGYVVPDKALAEMAAYLEQSLKSGAISNEMPHGGMADGDTRALFVMTLGRLGRSRPADVARLWRERDKLTGFGLSFLAVAAYEGHGDRSLLAPLLDEIATRAVETNKEAYFEGDRAQGYSMGSPLRTHAAALLAFSSAGRSKNISQSEKISPKLLRGLLDRRVGGMWGNTQENVFGIMAVAKSVERRGVGGNSPKVQVSLNGKELEASALQKLSANTLRYQGNLADGEKVKVVVKSGGGPPTIVNVRAEYDVPLTPESMKAKNHGFAVKRSYENLAGKSLDGAVITLGEVIAVRIRVTSKKQHNYVAIADRLPAGLEPLNSSLATTQKVRNRTRNKLQARGLSVLSYSETRDSRVAFYADDMPAGEYEFTYLARATSAGSFRRPAAQVDAMYDPEAVGTSSIDSVVIAAKASGDGK